MGSTTEKAGHPIRLNYPWVIMGVRYVSILVVALIVFAAVLLVVGKDPVQAYADTFAYTFGNFRGFSEVIARMIPLVLTATAVALPSRLGLINIGGEGQLYMGAWLATWAALTFDHLPKLILLPLVVLLGFIGGGLWAAVAGALRAKGWVHETISTLLLNYVAPAWANYFIFGPWRSPDSASYPQSNAFVDAARLPTFGDTRVHVGLILGWIALFFYWFLIRKTRWGLEMRAIGGNPDAARRVGIPIRTYMIMAMFLAGGIAGLAGMAQVSAVEGRLKQALSPGYGFAGFLISWLAGGNPLGILFMAFLLSMIRTGGDILQITQGLPFAVVNILLALVLMIVLARPALRGQTT